MAVQALPLLEMVIIKDDWFYQIGKNSDHDVCDDDCAGSGAFLI